MSTAQQKAEADAARNRGPVNCTYILRAHGKVYPRTCERCRLGPCPFYQDDTPAATSDAEAVREALRFACASYRPGERILGVIIPDNDGPLLTPDEARDELDRLYCPPPLAALQAPSPSGLRCSCRSGEAVCDYCVMVDDFEGYASFDGEVTIPEKLHRQVVAALASPDEAGRLGELLAEARLQLDYLDGRFPTGTTPAVIARIDAALSKQPSFGSGDGR